MVVNGHLSFFETANATQPAFCTRQINISKCIRMRDLPANKTCTIEINC